MKTERESVDVSTVMRMVRLFASNGVSKVRLTGGEPTLYPDLSSLISAIKSTAGIRHVGITTNGLILSRLAPSLSSAGLDSVNISLDSLIPAKFAFITKVDGFPKVMKSLEMSVGLFPVVKVNVVVMKGFNEDELEAFVALAGRLKVTVRFIEYMPFPGNTWSMRKFLSFEDTKTLISKRFQLQKDTEHDPIAEYYTVSGQSGRIGFISSISKPFCAACTRIRLTSDGNLKVCLHDSAEIPLDPLKSDSELLQDIQMALVRKRFEHDPASHLLLSSNRSMVNIGG